MRRQQGSITQKRNNRSTCGRDRTIPLPRHTFNFHAQRAVAFVELLDTHKNPHRQRFRQNAICDPLGQRFKQVQTFGGKLMLNRPSDPVIGEDQIHIIA